MHRVAEKLGPGPHRDFNIFFDRVEEDAKEHGVKLTAKEKKLMQNALADRSEQAEPVVKKRHNPGTAAPDPLHGLFETAPVGKSAVVEYESDSELRDTEQVPLLEEGGIEAFLQREVLPYAPDAWYAPVSVKIGYEISFTRYFYKPQPMRTLEEIRSDILALERETVGLLGEIIGADESAT